jgi:beta-glucosidase
LRATLVRIARDYAPPAIAITENGATFEDVVTPEGIEDLERLAYLASHLEAAANALDEGVPLIAYFAWSLLDNFEWALGYGTRFGIVHVDFASQRRTIKASGHWYRSLVGATTNPSR